VRHPLDAQRRWQNDFDDFATRRPEPVSSLRHATTAFCRVVHEGHDHVHCLAIIGVLGGLLALSPVIVKNSPGAAEKLEQLAKYSGYIGITMFVWGIWELFGVLTNIGMLGTAPITWVFWLLTGIADLGVGALLGFGLISTYVFRGNATAIEKGTMMRDKLVKFQIPLGALAIVMSILYLVVNFI